MFSSAFAQAQNGRGSPLARQLQLAWQLAVTGQEQPARAICEAIVAHHGSALGRDAAAKRALVRCLLLLRMPHLLARLLRVTDGMTLTCQPRRRDRLAFTTESGEWVELPTPPSGSESTALAEWAEAGCETLLRHASIGSLHEMPKAAKRAILLA